MWVARRNNGNRRRAGRVAAAAAAMAQVVPWSGAERGVLFCVKPLGIDSRRTNGHRVGDKPVK